MYVERDCSKKFRELVTGRQKEVLLLEGARQVGKSTLIEHVLQTVDGQVLAFNLEKHIGLKRDIDATSDFREFELVLRQLGFNAEAQQILYFDEAQESDCLGAYLRFMKENWQNTRVILTGSSMTRLFREHQRIPVGRYRRVILRPFSFREFLRATRQTVLLEVVEAFEVEGAVITPLFHEKLLAAYDAYLMVGGLPEVVRAFAEKESFREVRRLILLSQEEDFLRKTGSSDSHMFMAAFRGVVNYVGGVSKLSHIDAPTYKAREVLAELKKWHLIHEIEQKGIASTTSFHPKRYCYDIGIAQDVRNMPFPRLSLLDTLNSALRTQLGGLFENCVCNELLCHDAGLADISGWRENVRNSVEVDFVWRQGERVIPLECKASKKITPRAASSLLRYLRQSQGGEGIVVSVAPYEVFEYSGARIVNIPIYLCSAGVIRGRLTGVSGG